MDVPLWIAMLFLLCFGGFAYRSPRSALWLTLALLPTYLIRFSLGPLPFTLLEGMVLLVVGATILQRGPRSLFAHLLRDRWTPFLLLLTIASTLALVWTPDLLGGLGIWKAYFIEPILWFIAYRTLIQTESDQIKSIWFLGLGTVLITVFGWAQWGFDRWIPAPWDTERRITSIFPFPNAIGLLLGPISVLMAGVAHRAWIERTKRDSVFLRPSVAVVASGLITVGAWTAIWLSKGEAALVSLIVCGILVAFWHAGKKGWALVALGAPTIYIATKIKTLQFVWDKLLLRDESGQTRRFIWQETIAFLRDHPLTGAGLNGYPEQIIPYHVHTFLERFQYPHNLLLNIWTELGIFGVLLAIYGAFLTISTILSQKNSWIQLIAFLALVQMAIHGLVDVPFFKNDLALLTATCLALLALPYAKTGFESHT